MTRTSQLAKPFEIRDPVHGFIALDDTERQVLDSRPMQRLKHIHQLAMTYQVYPGATHKRFEHCLGVMELAGRAFDVIMNPANLESDVRDAFPELFRSRQGVAQLQYWRRVVRLAALCHDVGHLPFSHAAERDLLPAGKGHEWLSGELILHDEDLGNIWRASVGPINGEHVMKLALGADKCGKLGINLSNWENLLASIVVDDSLGVDRMDYLLRDSHHLGVAYGRFDLDRLIQSLRILSWGGPTDSDSVGPFELGIDEGGLHAVEGLLLARYFMFMQVYFHHTRLAYDIHLSNFMKDWISTEVGTIDRDTILQLTDNEVLAAVAAAARASGATPDVLRLHERRHYKRLRKASTKELAVPGLAWFETLGRECKEVFPGHADFRTESVSRPERDIPVKRVGERIQRFSALSDVAGWSGLAEPTELKGVGYIFISREKADEAKAWLNEYPRKDEPTEEPERA